MIGYKCSKARKERGKERQGREERKGRKRKRRKGNRKESKRKEKKGTTAIWSDIVRNIGWKYYPALDSKIFGVIFPNMYKCGRPGGHQIDGL